MQKLLAKAAASWFIPPWHHLRGLLPLLGKTGTKKKKAKKNHNPNCSRKQETHRAQGRQCLHLPGYSDQRGFNVPVLLLWAWLSWPENLYPLDSSICMHRQQQCSILPAMVLLPSTSQSIFWSQPVGLAIYLRNRPASKNCSARKCLSE